MARSTIADILKRHGAEPAPEWKKKTTWKEFLAQHWDLLVATDFFTVEVWTRKGLQRFIVLFFIELSTRKVEIAGISSVANGLWMTQIVRNVTDAVDGILKGKRYLIHDRDPLYTAEFLTMLRGVGVESVKLPPRSPNLSLQVWTPAGKRQALHIRCWQSVPERGAELLISIVQNSLSSQEGPTTWRAFTVYAFVRTDLRVALAYLTSPAPPVSVAGPVAPGRTYQCQC